MGGVGKVITCTLFGLFGLVALFFAANADDGGIYYGGLLIFAVAVAYIFWQIKRAMDAADQAQHEHGHGHA
jgi:FtsH-binding integral membrane protein